MEFKITITKTIPGFALIAALVAIAFEINKLQPAISPLALSVLFGFLFSNLASWPTWAEAGTKIAGKRVMRIGVALLGKISRFRDVVQGIFRMRKLGKGQKILFGLDNKSHDISENDIARRNTIVKLLEDWELLEVRYPDLCKSPLVPISQIKILSYKEKDEYNLVSKYNIGKVKK